ncbi:YgfZ/GcvT domain-containing protein [Aureimonas populi]|uniref:YgfZ/GcvT domain-containing protein n=1 Tax=Aureimonas populi TaxID=1701758 RepID=A0ABW5CJM1_9HYPH|nr:folate-binding protein YgfZ [Aureimonas populi]
MPSAPLPDRAILTVTGEDAGHFLQNLITADLDMLGEGEARPAALLTPQGKILFDFLVSRIEGGFRLDVAGVARADLLKRLTLYKLRSKVALAPGEEAVGVSWEEAGEDGLVDRRFTQGNVRRHYGEPLAGDAQDFHALRIAAGIMEAEADFPASDVFPHDVLLDQNDGVSFRKGCYVGQEVVSRMQHRGTARRRVMVLRAESHITPGANVEVGGRTVGTVLAAAGTVAAALVRIDKVAGALRAGEELVVDGVPAQAEIPEWAGYALPEEAPAGDAS